MSGQIDRRRFIEFFSAAGLGSTLLPGALYAAASQDESVTKEHLAQAEKIAGLEFTDEEREMMVRGLNQNLRGYQRLRDFPLDNSVPPALVFDPRPPGAPIDQSYRPVRLPEGPVPNRPGNLEEMAFWPVSRLANAIRHRVVSSLELTEMYLERLERFDAQLHCVVTLMKDQAIAQAKRADEELGAGRYRGPLHGIPWGAKDLLATRGTRTTWGAKPFESQMIDEDATVVERLDRAGAVLLAKLTLGALAMGDVWFGGKTRNPWNPEQGSSGSSAGSASAVTAGLVGFAIGTETLGSIVSPCSRCGATGLRPTFGRVSRHGAMALSWTMDKIGPIARSAEDCALVFAAIQGPDGKDPTVRSATFGWDPNVPLRDMRIAFAEQDFQRGRRGGDFDQATLEVLEQKGAKLEAIAIPDLPYRELLVILHAEAATAFDDITRDGRVRELVSQGPGSWPNSFRTAQMIPAVEYLRAMRVRSRVIEEVDALFRQYDVIVTPAFNGNALVASNLTGHPCVVMPNGFRDNGSPSSITFLGPLDGEAKMLAAAHHYQQATDHHLKQPEAITRG
ncbi:MAG: amidase [Planctomycetota bacterium]